VLSCAGMPSNQFSRDDPIDVIDKHMREGEDSWLWFDGYGSLIGMRACTDVKAVTLDISDLVGGGRREGL
jgi:hypothetical protein